MNGLRLALCAGAGTDGSGQRHQGGIRIIEVDPAAGTVRQLAESASLDHPSCLAWSSTTLYVGGERPVIDGQVTALRLQPDGIYPLGQSTTGGNGAVHLCLDRTGRFVFVANYQDAAPADQVSVAVFALGTEGALGALTGSASHTGHGHDPHRQDRPHCHGVAISPDNSLLAAVDLGTDSVYLYRFDAATGAISLAKQLTLPPGCGPRHAVFHPSRPLLYVTGELDSSLMTVSYSVDGSGATLLVAEDSTREGGRTRNYPSGIAISPNGRFVLAANRGADTIAVFVVDPLTGIARPRDEIACGGRFPRAIRLDPSARFLAVANQKSDSACLFGWDSATGTLSEKPIAEISIPIPLDAVFIDA